jgi:hypothetical protein
VDDFDNQETDYFCNFEQQPEEDHNVIYPKTTQTAASCVEKKSAKPAKSAEASKRTRKKPIPYW